MNLSGLATDLASCALAVLPLNRLAPINMLAAVKAKGFQLFFVILVFILILLNLAPGASIFTKRSRGSTALFLNSPAALNQGPSLFIFRQLFLAQADVIR